MMPITITTLRKNLPGWLGVMLLLCSAAFYLPSDGVYCSRPSVQNEQVYTGRCCKGRTISYFRALSACIPAVSYRVPVTYILAFADRKTLVQLRCAEEVCRRFEVVPHLPQLKISFEPAPTAPHMI
ncbi:hypothetical protein [Chitinophaga qingshengii]|uniref:Uncharacterized protein n=1 Tax=Chitinophaga qingshengii TaxID=1569794 RepID=A0ABR7TM22_9BACT|nr:hypothetical protein [Chitinophaga qingshengii]MBC9931035.1 hypothetical protein [Chitinophaga qingshengii]